MSLNQVKGTTSFLNEESIAYFPYRISVYDDSSGTNASITGIIGVKKQWEIGGGSSGPSIEIPEGNTLEILTIQNQEIIQGPIEHLRTILGVNISEVAEILLVTRQSIYDWKSGNSRPTPNNQERINKLLSICKKWECTNLGPIRHLVRQNISNNYSLFNLLCSNDLDETQINLYFDKIKAYIIALNKEKEESQKVKSQYGFKQLSNEEKFKILKQNSGKIG